MGRLSLRSGAYDFACAFSCRLGRREVSLFGMDAGRNRKKNTMFGSHWLPSFRLSRISDIFCARTTQKLRSQEL